LKERYVLEAQQTGLGLYQLKHGRISSVRIMTLTETGPSTLWLILKLDFDLDDDLYWNQASVTY
jgi:hypothetical protein